MTGKSWMSAKLAAIMMAGLPMVWSVVVHSGAAPKPLHVAAPSLPSLSFRQYAVDLGKIDPVQQVAATFVFANRGHQPVSIDSVTPSCGCLVPLLPKEAIVPGTEGKIVLRMQPANEQPGRKELFADVSYHDPEPRTVRLTFKSIIPERLMTVSPPSLIIYHPAGSEPTHATFTVSDGRKKPFELTSVEANTDLVEATIGERSLGADGNWQQKVDVIVRGDLPPGRHPTLLRIATTDSTVPELRVPLLLQGPSLKSEGEGDAHAKDDPTHRIRASLTPTEE